MNFQISIFFPQDHSILYGRHFIYVRCVSVLHAWRISIFNFKGKVSMKTKASCGVFFFRSWMRKKNDDWKSKNVVILKEMYNWCDINNHILYVQMAGVLWWIVSYNLHLLIPNLFELVLIKKKTFWSNALLLTTKPSLKKWTGNLTGQYPETEKILFSKKVNVCSYLINH